MFDYSGPLLQLTINTPSRLRVPLRDTWHGIKIQMKYLWCKRKTMERNGSYNAEALVGLVSVFRMVVGSWTLTTRKRTIATSYGCLRMTGSPLLKDSLFKPSSFRSASRTPRKKNTISS
ncbi:hypothetical protein AG1IA_10151 [Rhizoctonia solani AG-1 IA]|uniref:Uncharacterized protein n=1 Tax=Thanatephorus cucumeris (strain AG1-IA) TaxID=983506 RepID=L8WHI5_THACA|nr:hypothetical protein AG1IA_10151 [Rhizoctonia solani AG-1 IA]